MRSGVKAGMEAWTTGPSVQAALRGKLRKKARDSGAPRRGGREAGAGSWRNTEEASSLSIALSLWGRGSSIIQGKKKNWPRPSALQLPGSHTSATLNSMATKKFWPHQCN